MKIEIFTEYDSSDCETCGSNYDEGGYVLIDGKEVFNYTPLAGCFGNANYNASDLLFLSLKEIGFEISVDGDLPYSYTKYNEDMI